MSPNFRQGSVREIEASSQIPSATPQADLTDDAANGGSKPRLCDREDGEEIRSQPSSWFSKKYRVLLCGFLTSLSFGVTQVALFYVFRLMLCDAYYESHSKPGFTGVTVRSPSQWTEWRSFEALAKISHYALTAPNKDDRCSLRPIEASTAVQISLLGASTTIFGTINLLATGALIKAIGVQRALMIQVFFPAVRLLIQNIGLEVWGYTGVIIVQSSQIATIIGGPSGYVLCLNQFITEVVDYEGRTAALGMLAGTMMFGSAFGLLAGGLLADAFDIKAPFRLTLVLFLFSTIYVAVFLPHIAPASSDEGNTAISTAAEPNNELPKKSKLQDKLFEPLLIFAPKRFVLEDGTTRMEYGAFLLACGVFLGVLATGFLAILLQLYSTDVFGFGTKENGWLVFTYSILRGVFLTFAFPRLIAAGRRFVARREARKTAELDQDAASEQRPLLQGQQEQSGAAATPKAERQVFTFDLTYTRFSIVADGLLTLLCTFIQQGWQMYLVAAILPFAAGTGSASKGTVLQIVGATASSAERTDALAGISLVENIARLTTNFVFGAVFAALTNVGHPELVFTVNASCALIAFIVLLFARFPPQKSRRLVKH